MSCRVSNKTHRRRSDGESLTKDGQDLVSDHISTKSINRVLKPKGKLVWGCKFANLPRENAEFANVSRRAIVDAMGEAGFEVSTAKVSVDGGDPKKDYVELLEGRRSR